MQPELLQALSSGARVLTATRRLARWLRQQHDAAQRAAGRAAWESPAIDPLADWLRECWDELLDGPSSAGRSREAPAASAGRSREAPVASAGRLLLSDAQAEAVWEHLLQQDPEAGRVLHPRAAAALAQEAWELTHLWQVPAFAARDESPDVAAYLRWAAAYARRCDERGWLDGARLPGVIATALRGGALEAPAAVALAGFDDLQPGYQAVIDALQSRGYTVTHVPAPNVTGDAVVSPWPDAEAETEAAARWTRHWLEQGAAGPIGIVVPNLTERRAQVERHLREVLAPGSLLPGATGEPPFNLSAGLPLAEVPLVRTALTLLHLWRERVPLDVAGHVLRTPFLAAGESERSARGLLEARLREVGELEPTVGTLERLASPGAGGEARPWHCTGLARALHAMLAFKAGLPRTQPCTAWARAFHDWLAALGWPGERPLDSAEHQAREKWQAMLEIFAHLERVLPQLTWPDALSQLEHLAGNTIFQPESPDTPVQVLGLLESGGLEFQHLWVLGLEDDAWPPAPQPNPFLPLALQRRLGLPHASAARELELARRHTERLRRSAPNVVFSHALRRGDEELRASPLLAHLPAVPPETVPRSAVPLSAVPRPAEALQGAGELEAWTDDRAPPVAHGTAVSGGTGIFRDMAACPFRAFAVHRLHAASLAEPVPGLGADRRGQLAHRALEFLWRTLGDHAALAALTPPAARTRVEESVLEAIGACEHGWGRRLSPAVAQLERRRLTVLLLELLELERGRAPFRVAAKEERREVTVGGVTLHVQIDRVDELPDGRRLLLDYKTGRETSVDAWFSDRPDEPQLPIYAVTSRQPIHAVGFVRVRHGDPGFVCITDGIEVPRKAPGGSARPPRPQPGFAGFVERATGHEYGSREEVLAAWQATLTRLGERFRAGQAAVDPKDPAKTCQFCDLATLCRIDPLRQMAGEPESPAGDDDAA